MTVLFDLQAIQSSDTFDWASLFSAISGPPSDGHQPHFLLNGNEAKGTVRVFSLLRTYVPRENVHVFFPIETQGCAPEQKTWRDKSSALLLESLLSGLSLGCIVQIDPDGGAKTSFMTHVLGQFSGKKLCLLEVLQETHGAPTPSGLYDQVMAYPKGREGTLATVLSKLLETQDQKAHWARKVSLFEVIPALDVCLPQYFSQAIKNDFVRASISFAHHIPQERRKHLYVDVTSLAQQDFKTGIQRVVRSVLELLPSFISADFIVQPVRGDETGKFKNASSWLVDQYFGDDTPKPEKAVFDRPIDPLAGDVFFGLDFSAQLFPLYEQTLAEMQALGVPVHFVVYDIIPLLRPDFFSPHMEPAFRKWITSIALNCDSLICISRTVSEQVKEWLEEHLSHRERLPEVKWFHLGSDFDAKKLQANASAAHKALLSRLEGAKNFLVVATLEPRKGYSCVLDAFERLWKKGLDVNLVLVGRVGWMMEGVHQRILDSPYLEKKMHWLGGVSDSDLEGLYRAADYLVLASEAEGFGLPIVEATYRGLEVIASDIPVFREVGADSIHYFEVANPISLAEKIEELASGPVRDFAANQAALEPHTWSKAVGQLVSLMNLADQPPNVAPKVLA